MAKKTSLRKPSQRLSAMAGGVVPGAGAGAAARARSGRMIAHPTASPVALKGLALPATAKAMIRD
jgi:hypothetical protein